LSRVPLTDQQVLAQLPNELRGAARLKYSCSCKRTGEGPAVAVALLGIQHTESHPDHRWTMKRGREASGYSLGKQGRAVGGDRTLD
jgi:hypothetical protein